MFVDGKTKSYGFNVTISSRNKKDIYIMQNYFSHASLPICLTVSDAEDLIGMLKEAIETIKKEEIKTIKKGK